MTANADIQTPETPGEGTPPAGGQELTIPKHRLDEVIRERERLREELAMKDRLYTETISRMAPAPQASAPQEMTPEESGLDPAVHAAVMKLNKQAIAVELKKAREEVQNLVGLLANRNEKTEFLFKYGKAAEKHLPQIQAEQRKFAQETGGYLNMEIAYKMAMFDMGKVPEAPKATGEDPNASPASPSAPTAPAQSLPNPALTRVQHAGGQAVKEKSSIESSIEELEARLEKGFAEGNVL